MSTIHPHRIEASVTVVAGLVSLPVEPRRLLSTIESRLLDREREHQRLLAVLATVFRLPDLTVVDRACALPVFECEPGPEPIADGSLCRVERLAVTVAVEELGLLDCDRDGVVFSEVDEVLRVLGLDVDRKLGWEVCCRNAAQARDRRRGCRCTERSFEESPPSAGCRFWTLVARC